MEIVFTSSTTKNLKTFEENLARLPHDMARFTARSLAREGKEFVANFRASLAGKFKVKRTKVANIFKWYVRALDKAVDGKATLDEISLNVFTTWVPAPIYEEGGTIKDPRGGGIAIPVHKSAFTADGRIKARWRNPRNFQGLESVKTKRGIVLLYKPLKSVKQEDGRRATSLGSLGRANKDKAIAWDVYFVVVMGTSRRAVLSFHEDFARHAGEIGARVQPRMEKHLGDIDLTAETAGGPA